MHCECCDVILNDEEATAKFADSGHYVSMCAKCRKHLPKDLKITTRYDLVQSRQSRKEQEAEDAETNDYDLKWSDYDGEEQD
jgi:uncharacterized metal-binding protein YceD (DUF177 family)